MKFFQAYNQFSQPTEPAERFHLWTSLSVVSALLGKKCFIPQGHFTVFPNLYVILVGDPATRKSSALDIGMDVISQIETIPLAPSNASREALIDTIKDGKVEFNLDGKDMSYRQLAVFASEFSQFLGGNHLNKPIIDFLTDIWDRKVFKERTRKGGFNTVENPYLSLLGCCTPSWISECLKDKIIQEGFTRRVIFVLERDFKINAWPTLTPQQNEAWPYIISEANRIHRVKGEFNFTKEALALYKPFYDSLRASINKRPARIQNYFSSKHILVLKLCMCISAARDDSRIVDSKVLSACFKILQDIEVNLEEVFSGVGRNEAKPYIDRIQARIAKSPEGIGRKDLLKEFYGDLSLSEFDEALSILVGTGLVRQERESVAEDGLYLATKKPPPRQDSSLFRLVHPLTPPSEAVVSNRTEIERMFVGGPSQTKTKGDSLLNRAKTSLEKKN